MSKLLGEALAGFDAALDEFRAALAHDPVLSDWVFAGTAEWAALLTYKLAPHLGGEGCLVVAVTGGTNTGKSTVFDLLLGQVMSPVVTTAAATRHPLLAGNAWRVAQCLDSKLVPEFQPRLLDDPSAVVSNDTPPDTLYVAEAVALPDRLVLLDTPDVDSIDKQNWEVADHIRAAGDVLVAVLTGEKYKDERVVDFFRRARASGRVVVPLMNKANPARDFAVARAQLADFCADVGIEDAQCFAIPHDFALLDDLTRPILALDGDADLWSYLNALDVPAIKQRVYRDTVSHFADRAAEFLERCRDGRDTLRTVADEFESRARVYAEKYDPIPGTEIGGLFHEFVQSKRGPIRRAIGSASAEVARGLGAVAKAVTGAFWKRVRLETPEKTAVDEEIRAIHKRSLDQITHSMAASYIESSRNLREPAAHVVEQGLIELDIDPIADAAIRQTLRSENISKEFRQHARRTIEAWWNDHAGRRHSLEALDTLLAVMPAAIAAPIGMYTAGFGVSEAIVVAGPVVEQFVARVIEYQFGDQMFDLLSPWRAEQQENFAEALVAHLTGPSLRYLHEALEPFEGETMADLERWHAQCLNAL
ncbi:MAG: hypothetical protein QG656_2241 [Candidatus Hydrogenedentes bacterium]|nr:hypothetical protein [Candidatus Hydrogenedentota bacterium]